MIEQSFEFLTTNTETKVELSTPLLITNLGKIPDVFKGDNRTYTVIKSPSKSKPLPFLTLLQSSV